MKHKFYFTLLMAVVAISVHAQYDEHLPYIPEGYQLDSVVAKTYDKYEGKYEPDFEFAYEYDDMGRQIVCRGYYYIIYLNTQQITLDNHYLTYTKNTYYNENGGLLREMISEYNPFGDYTIYERREYSEYDEINGQPTVKETYMMYSEDMEEGFASKEVVTKFHGNDIEDIEEYGHYWADTLYTELLYGKVVAKHYDYDENGNMVKYTYLNLRPFEQTKKMESSYTYDDQHNYTHYYDIGYDNDGNTLYEYDENYELTYKSDGLLQRRKQISDDPYLLPRTYFFFWSKKENALVKEIDSANKHPVTTYDLSGRIVVDSHKGITIQRMSDGTVRKVLNK